MALIFTCLYNKPHRCETIPCDSISEMMLNEVMFVNPVGFWALFLYIWAAQQVSPVCSER